LGGRGRWKDYQIFYRTKGDIAKSQQKDDHYYRGRRTGILKKVLHPYLRTLPFFLGRKRGQGLPVTCEPGGKKEHQRRDSRNLGKKKFSSCFFVPSRHLVWGKIEERGAQTVSRGKKKKGSRAKSFLLKARKLPGFTKTWEGHRVSCDQ